MGSQRTAVLATALGTTLALGCASPAPPRPPSLHLPEPASKLEAKRLGDEVRLSWMISAKTTDGTAIHGTITAVVCRESGGNGSTVRPSPSCDEVKRMKMAPGSANMTDVLPRSLSTGAAALLAYRIDLLNDGGRSAGMSELVYAAGGAAPPPVGEATVSVRRGAALIQWRPQPGGIPAETTMELHRMPTGVLVPRPSRAVKTPSNTTFGNSKEPTGEVILTVEAKEKGAADHTDPGGTLDTTVRDGDSYVYVAQRVTRVTLQGHALEVRGVASPAVDFTFRDTFPPKVPSGLISVPGAGFSGSPSIDLSWDLNAESDLLGYNVYRRIGSAAFAKLNREPVPSSSFRDMQVVPGQTYSYRVTAIDRRGNESAPGSEIHESLRQ